MPADTNLDSETAVFEGKSVNSLSTLSTVPVIEAQVHIPVGCADARDVGQVHIEAVRDTQ